MSRSNDWNKTLLQSVRGEQSTSEPMSEEQIVMKLYDGLNRKAPTTELTYDELAEKFRDALLSRSVGINLK
jgi:hypothetical protein